MSLLGSVFDPVKVHVNHAGSLLFDGAIDDSAGHSVVSLERSCRLIVAHFGEIYAEDGGF